MADVLARDYGGQDTSPVTIALSAAPSERAGMDAYAATLRELDGVRSVSAARSLDGDTWQIDVAVAGQPDGDATQARSPTCGTATR